MNKKLVNDLETIKNHYKVKNDVFRVKAYDAAIFHVSCLKKRIQSTDEVFRIGKSIKEKIQEYIDTNQIQIARDLQQEELRTKSVEKDSKIFETIWGVGPSKAKKLYESGIRNIKELKKNPILLNKQQLIGLKHYEDLLKRVTRNDIDMFKNYVKKTLDKRFGKKSYKFEIAGSYRRGKETSGDVDIVITSSKFNLNDVVETLKYNKYVTDVLSCQNEKSMMVATIPGVLTYHFRLDIEFVKEEEFYSCLLYFTGSKDFNIAMRSRAKKMGMILNQHGLFDLKTRRRYLTKKEEDIFDKLNLVFVPPKDR